MGVLSKLFGGGGNAVEEARREEERRKAEITAGQRRIEGIFSSSERAKQIEDFIASQRGLLQTDLNRTQEQNQRQLKFSLARGGLSGGSTDVDQNRTLAELFFRGTAEVERRAQNSGAQLRNLDQQSKQGLFAQLLGGADITTAAQNANQQLRVNTGLSRTANTFGNFDSLFGNFANIFKNSRIAAGERRANKNLNFGTLFSPSQRINAPVAGVP